MECEVSKIIPVGGSGLNFERIVKKDQEDGFINPKLYPLAGNRGGDLYYWEKGTEKVFLLNDDNIEHPVLVAKNIASFFELLSRNAK